MGKEIHPAGAELGQFLREIVWSFVGILRGCWGIVSLMCRLLYGLWCYLGGPSFTWKGEGGAPSRSSSSLGSSTARSNVEEVEVSEATSFRGQKDVTAVMCSSSPIRKDFARGPYLSSTGFQGLSQDQKFTTEAAGRLESQASHMATSLPSVKEEVKVPLEFAQTSQAGGRAYLIRKPYNCNLGLVGRQKFHVVARGRFPGMYRTWPEAQRQVNGFSGQKNRAFPFRHQAVEWLQREMAIGADIHAHRQNCHYLGPDDYGHKVWLCVCCDEIFCDNEPDDGLGG